MSALAGSAGRLLRLIDGSGVMSATGLQGWATCPYSYFMERVLRVEPTETPEDVWTIDALEGSDYPRHPRSVFSTRHQ